MFSLMDFLKYCAVAPFVLLLIVLLSYPLRLLLEIL